METVKIYRRQSMHNCTCQRTEIDWHANNTEVSNPHEVEVSVENVHRHGTLDACVSCGSRAYLKVRADLAVKEAFCRMTGRLD